MSYELLRSILDCYTRCFVCYTTFVILDILPCIPCIPFVVGPTSTAPSSDMETGTVPSAPTLKP